MSEASEANKPSKASAANDAKVFESAEFEAEFLDRMRFIVEIDRVKNIFRQTYIMDHSRRENDAEHSWHLAMMAMLLADYANEKIDVLHVIKMVLVHDIVEIDAGDTFCYDYEARRDKAQRERAAADRIFAILPAPQAAEVRALWDEFEAKQSAEAKFAAAIDRLQPLMCNYATGGAAWREHDITLDIILPRNAHIADGSRKLWDYALAMVTDASERKWMGPRSGGAADKEK